MFIRLYTNILNFDHKNFFVRTISQDETNLVYQTPCRFLCNINTDNICVFNERDFDLVKKTNPNKEVYLVTNIIDYYLKNKTKQEKLRYVPIFHSTSYPYNELLDKKNNVLEISKVTNHNSDFSYVKQEMIDCLFEEFDTVCYDFGSFAPAGKITMQNINKNNENNITFVFHGSDFIMPSITHKLMFLSALDISLVWNVEIINDVGDFTIYWLKEQEEYSNHIFNVLNYYDIKNIIEKDKYYKVIMNSLELYDKNIENIKQCYSMLEDIENNVFLNCKEANDILNKCKER